MSSEDPYQHQNFTKSKIEIWFDELCMRHTRAFPGEVLDKEIAYQYYTEGYTPQETVHEMLSTKKLKK